VSAIGTAVAGEWVPTQGVRTFQGVQLQDRGGKLAQGLECGSEYRELVFLRIRKCRYVCTKRQIPTINKWRARTQLPPRVSHRKCQTRKTPSWPQLAIQDLEDIPDKGVKRLSFFEDFGIFGGLRCQESSCDVDVRVRFPQKVCLGTVSINARRSTPFPHTCFRILCG